MCGIAAIISKKDNNIPGQLLKAMTDVIAHRGPDGEGFFFGHNFATGHRRLAIIDLTDDGKQPMQRHGLIITFNGEIFNYVELREQLVSLGYHFETQTDTEVVLQGYRHWGYECQNLFIGMWAFVIYDPACDILFCSRDRYCQKPFHYTTLLGEYFLIGSEIKQFTVLPDFEAELDLDTSFDFLEQTLLNHTDSTFFKGVKSLPGGHQLIYNLKSHQFKITKWYQPDFNELNTINFIEGCNMYAMLLRDSIKMRLRSDVTVGIALSGGIDSSAITCIVADIDQDGRYTAVTSCYDDQKYDERYYAELVTQKAGLELVKKFPDLHDLINLGVLNKISYYHEQPIASCSHFSEYSVFEEARMNDISVMLCGQGPDEHSGGYSAFFSYYYLDLLKKFRWIKLFSILRRKPGGLKTNLKLMGGFLFLNSLKAKPNVFIDYQKFGRKFVKPKANLFRKGNSIRELSIIQVFKTSIPYQAHSEDRNSMCFSIESRSPYLDHRLLEFAITLPDKYKVKDDVNKWILREAVKKYLPGEVNERKTKMGFVAPDELWFRKDHEKLFPMLHQAVNDLKGLVKENIISEYTEFIYGEGKYDPLWFKVISLASVIRQYQMKIKL